MSLWFDKNKSVDGEKRVLLQFAEELDVLHDTPNADILYTVPDEDQESPHDEIDILNDNARVTFQECESDVEHKGDQQGTYF